VLLGVGPSQSVEYVFGDEGPKCCWHTQGEVGQAQGMLVSLPPLDRDCNQLSDELINIESSEEFKNRLTKLYYGG
jgi:hypothetical protein